MTTATKTKPVEFLTKYSDLRLVRLAEMELHNQAGHRVGKIGPGSPHNEKYDIADDGAPWAIQFKDSYWSTEMLKEPGEDEVPEERKQVILDWLRSHPSYGVKFYEQKGSLGEPEPTIAQQLEKISIASVRLDVQALEDVRDEEKATHNREVVVQSAEVALGTIAGDPKLGAGATTDDGGPPSNSTS